MMSTSLLKRVGVGGKVSTQVILEESGGELYLSTTLEWVKLFPTGLHIHGSALGLGLN